MDKVIYKVDVRRAFEQVLVITRTATRSPSPTCKARSSSSTPDPHPASDYVGNGRPRGPRPKTPETVTEVLTHQLSPMS